jgi:protein gp37
MARRLQAMGQPNYVNAFELTLHEDALEMPLRWKRPQRIFVNSMSDLFHEDVPDAFIFRAFNVMRRAFWHQFQVLTKRSDRLLDISPHLPWADNIWMGVSIENQKYTYRIEHLRQAGAKIKFLSLEPLLGPLRHLRLEGMDWVILPAQGVTPINVVRIRTFATHFKWAIVDIAATAPAPPSSGAVSL